MPPLFTIDISREWGPGYALFLEDVARMICIQFTIQIMIYFTTPGSVGFFTSEFLMMLTYVIMGVAVYWLVLKRVLVFK